MTFWVNQKVVFIGFAFSWRRLLFPHPGESPVKDRVYEIENLTPTGCLELRGVNSPSDFFWNAGFHPRLFRPIVETKTEVSFTIGADPSTDQFDNRRKVRKKVAI